MKIPESTCIPRKALLLKERFFKNTVEIKVIDQNIKDFVQAQISISERADHALSGLNLHSPLGNVSESGRVAVLRKYMRSKHSFKPVLIFPK
jgi:hypothetical protein